GDTSISVVAAATQRRSYGAAATVGDERIHRAGQGNAGASSCQPGGTHLDVRRSGKQERSPGTKAESKRTRIGRRRCGVGRVKLWCSGEHARGLMEWRGGPAS